MAIPMQAHNTALRTPYGTFGNAVRTLRLKRELTQEQLGKKVGVTQPCIAAYEIGRVRPSQRIMANLAVVFNVPVELLMAHKRSLFTT